MPKQGIQPQLPWIMMSSVLEGPVGVVSCGPWQDQEYCNMPIAQIRFTQNSVAAKFAHGALKGTWEIGKFHRVLWCFVCSWQIRKSGFKACLKNATPYWKDLKRSLWIKALAITRQIHSKAVDWLKWQRICAKEGWQLLSCHCLWSNMEITFGPWTIGHCTQLELLRPLLLRVFFLRFLVLHLLILLVLVEAARAACAWVMLRCCCCWKVDGFRMKCFSRPTQTNLFHMNLQTSAEVLNAASRHSEPFLACVTTFQLCPVTAKFLQLRCGSLLEEPTWAYCMLERQSRMEKLKE